ncbi:hypothetical protein M758_12G009200 [Ceratodon purpureus]|uniref:Uncharacterized protein n=1 Tax=Ceratodon purpureus TaxID=3225 RepID=A0A8T0G5N5_CERPU|nr:hypothetical protein KC19_12G008500 [Ceratodon purpureus]KAG0597620.1 hypothetical protein M758_12G009200 [Ceratodon purpureus]
MPLLLDWHHQSDAVLWQIHFLYTAKHMMLGLSSPKLELSHLQHQKLLSSLQVGHRETTLHCHAPRIQPLVLLVLLEQTKH